MLEHRKRAALRRWIADAREQLAAKAYALTDGFLAAFYGQCVESTAVDAQEIFLEDVAAQYFRARMAQADAQAVLRFFKLAAIHHTIRTIQKRKKELDWAQMLAALAQVYGLDARERQMAELLYQCAQCYPSGFQLLFYQVTARYLFGERELDAFSFAFIGNFWYNSYHSFMGSFTGYVPFHIRLRDAL